MGWWQTLIVALATYGGTRLLDELVRRLREPREFRKQRREYALQEIEQFKGEVGRYVELASNWKSHEQKESAYLSLFENDYELIGRLTKYPPVAKAGRDTLHWCMIVASEEKNQSGDLVKRKEELAEKHRDFLKKCDEYLDSIV